ncbi:MAG: META domain-containing protein [Flavobacterium sp.]
MKHKSIILLLLVFSLFSCGSKKSNPTLTQLDKNTLYNSYFSGYGSEPMDWTLEISEESIRFATSDGSYERNTPHVEPIKAMDANVKFYEITTESGILRIDIIMNSCENQSKISDYSITVKVTDGKGDESLYNGCGTYHVDYRLHDVWVLEKIQEREVTPEMFNGEIPMIEIKSSTKEFNGFGGCNRIRGQLFQEREVLRFVEITSSKMLCDPQNKEDFFLKQLQSGIHYELINNRLFIKNPNGILVVFKKID